MAANFRSIAYFPRGIQKRIFKRHWIDKIMPGASIPSVLLALRRTHYFKSMPDPALEEVLTFGRTMSFEKGAEIISFEEQSDDVFFLLEGSAQIVIYSPDGQVVGFREIRAGDILGEFSAIDRRLRSATVEALSNPTVLLRLSRQKFWFLMNREPTFMRAIVEHLANIARSLTQRVYEFATLAADHRIRAELLRMALADESQDGLTVINSFPSQTQFATRVSTTREAVNRELSRLGRLGIISREGRKLIVHDKRRLARMVESVNRE